MKTQNKPHKSATAIKQKTIAAVAMLLVSLILLMSVSFAWLILSTAPEITGVATTIGANGSLEMALLNATTKADLSKIPTMVGGSLVKDSVAGNYTWGNLVDLHDESFGLSSIKLLPARLNAEKGDNGYIVDPRYLYVPTYEHDGRIVDINANNVLTATHINNAFTISDPTQYGVRAIGTSSFVTPQMSALNYALVQITVYTSSARSKAISAINNDTLQDIILEYQLHKNDAQFNNEHLDGLKNMITNLEDSAEYIDLAIRQGAIAYAASKISDETLFNSIENEISNPESTLSDILTENDIEPPAEFNAWLDALEDLKNDINGAKTAAAALNADYYSWSDISPIFSKIINIESGKVYVNGTSIKEMTAEELTGLLGSDIRIDLTKGSGLFSNIADFTGEYSTFIDFFGEAEISVMGGAVPAYLPALSAVAHELEPAGGSGDNMVGAELTSTYGYVLDLAFRCNAPISSLLLQTEEAQRIYEDSTSPSTLGKGSYMEFPIGEHFSLEQTTKLADAVRVAFVDDSGNILGVAKLNTSNRVCTNNVFKAPLYLYDFQLDESIENHGAMIMGERRKHDNVITPLEQNEAVAISVVVWLDGDVVDNTMVAAENGYSVSGMLNLQFASSADLHPASNSDLMNMAPDKTTLKQLIDQSKEIYNNGQGMYTTVTWTAFEAAYNLAEDIYTNSKANEIDVYNAMKKIQTAKAGLTQTSETVLSDEIAKFREMMGTDESNTAYIIVKNGDTFELAAPDTLLKSEGTILAVDPDKNMHYEGNNIFTPIYTDESWSNLADALYNAELVLWSFQNGVAANTTAIDDAITKLNTAELELDRKIFYEPYDYEGYLYYKANTEDPDTYGKWYDPDFQRVVSDLLILKLDRYATPADILDIGLKPYMATNNLSFKVTPTLKQNISDFLKNEEILFFVMTKYKDEKISMAEEIEFEIPAPSPDNSSTWVLTVEEIVGNMFVVTKNGILARPLDSIVLYEKAEGATIITPPGLGDGAQLEAKLLYTNGSTHQEHIIDVIWSSGDSSVLAVSNNGTLDIKKAGSVQISALITTEEGNMYTTTIPITVY